MSTKLKIFLCFLGAAIALLIALAITGVFSSPSGYNNVQNLENSIQTELNARLASSGSGEYATSVICNPIGGTQYQCMVTGNEGPGDTSEMTVTVAPNGQSWEVNG